LRQAAFILVTLTVRLLSCCDADEQGHLAFMRVFDHRKDGANDPRWLALHEGPVKKALRESQRSTLLRRQASVYCPVVLQVADGMP
jgi:hypothetical protein